MQKIILVILLFIVVLFVVSVPVSYIGTLIFNEIGNLEQKYGLCTRGICQPTKNFLFEEAINSIGMVLFVLNIYICYSITKLIVRRSRKSE